jgi:thiosulfate/3-mercaptopyruvate sulfurtransferase
MRRFLSVFALVLLCAGTATAAVNSQLLVSSTWLMQNLGRRNVTIVEVGDRAAYEQAHIPGARFIALSDLVTERNGIPNELPEVAALERTFSAAGVRDLGQIVLYSRDLIPATRAFFTLDYLGCGSQAAILDGGFAKWSAENRPVESGPMKPRTAAFTARPNTDALVRLGQMRILVPTAQSMSSEIAVVDARPMEQYAGSEGGPGVKRPGHIPGAISIPYTLNLTSGATPVFRDAKELAELYHDCGVPLRGSVIAYCRTGMQASVTYFVMRYLGTDVHLYDGSYIEWNCAEGTTVFANADGAVPAQAMKLHE